MRARPKARTGHGSAIWGPRDHNAGTAATGSKPPAPAPSVSPGAPSWPPAPRPSKASGWCLWRASPRPPASSVPRLLPSPPASNPRPALFPVRRSRPPKPPDGLPRCPALRGTAVEAAVHFLHLLDLLRRGTAPELRFQPRVHNGLRQLRPYHPLAHRQDLGVVGFPRPFGRKHVVALGRPDPGHLVGRNVHPDARSAAQDGPVMVPLGDGLGDLNGDVRVVDAVALGGLGGVGAVVLDLVALFFEALDEGRLEFEGRVVGAYPDLLHLSTSLVDLSLPTVLFAGRLLLHSRSLPSFARAFEASRCNHYEARLRRLAGKEAARREQLVDALVQDAGFVGDVEDGVA